LTDVIMLGCNVVPMCSFTDCYGF